MYMHNEFWPPRPSRAYFARFTSSQQLVLLPAPYIHVSENFYFWDVPQATAMRHKAKKCDRRRVIQV